MNSTRSVAFVFCISLLCCPTIHCFVPVVPPVKTVKSTYTSRHAALSPMDATDVWWKEGVNFKCTGCGRCCMNEGEVWLDADEFHDLSVGLNMTYSAVLDTYVEQVQSNWVKLKSKATNVIPGLTTSPSFMSSSPGMGLSSLTSSSQCIFLDDDGKKCTIYESRPAQCRSYPYWPRLLSSRGSFDDEGVLPDDVGGPTAKHWTPDKGGCEGVNHAEALIVPSKTVHRNFELYKAYTESFPFMSNGDDRNRLLSAAEVIAAVVKSTRAWVDDFVIKYDLCPFAKSVFASEGVRYRVFLGTDKDRLKKRLRYEMLHLLTVPEEEVATTLLVAPFAFPEFADFYDFMVAYEDEELTSVLDAMRGPGAANSKAKKSRLVNRARDKVEGDKKEIQLASFHPAFQWAESEFDDPLNFEKRAPFPVINLLRANRVREYASEESTKRIGGYNAQSLGTAGSEKLRQEMEAIITLALS